MLQQAQQIANEICKTHPADYMREQEEFLQKNEPGTTVKRIDKFGNVVTRTISYSGVVCDQFRLEPSLVSFVIGTKGETLRSTEMACRVRVQVEREGNTIERLMMITGRPADVDRAKAMVDSQLEQGANQGNIPDEATGNVLKIPANKLGIIIGKQGQMLKELQSRSQARITIPRNQEGHERTIYFEGNTRDVQRARQMITDLISVQQDQFSGQPQSQLVMHIPVTKIGIVIGRGGETIKSINLETGTVVKIDLQSTSVNRKITITGEPEACQEAKRRIEELIGRY